MFCNQCGEENRNDRKFCANCGAPLRDYTKPRENLITREEVEEKQQAVQSKNKVGKILNIVTWGVFAVALVFMITAFFVPHNLELGFSIVAIVFCVATLVLMVAEKIYEHTQTLIISGKKSAKKRDANKK